jgi:predicted DNA-binding transcriptional regulator AlpA
MQYQQEKPLLEVPQMSKTLQTGQQMRYDAWRDDED